MERRISPRTTLIPKSILEVDTTISSKDMFIVVDEKQPDGSYKTKKMLLDTILKPVEPPVEEVILPDPYIKGEIFPCEIKINTKEHEGKWINDFTYPLGQKADNLIMNGEVVEVDEIYFTRTSLPLDYGSGTNHDPSWLNWLGYTDDMAKGFTGDKLNKLQLLNYVGGWGYFFEEGTRAWNIPNLITCQSNKLGNAKLVVPSYRYYEQVICQSPVTSPDIMQRFIDFAFMSEEENNLEIAHSMVGKGTSGLNLFPLGSKGNAKGATPYGFGWSCMLACNDGWERFNVLKEAVGGVKGLAFNNGAHGLQVRLALVKTPEELGYRLYEDYDNDKIVMLSVNEPTSLPELSIGGLRGVALRYANREKKVITKPLSFIIEEYSEIANQISFIA